MREQVLSPQQRRLPQLFLEHDPPREHPTDTRHVVDDPSMILVHVTHFNQLMWDSNRTPSTVIEHGVTTSESNVRFSGELERGLTIVNCIGRRGRRLGLDLFEAARDEVDLDIAGMESEQLGGLGEIPWIELHAVAARYRFFFNPIRYTSLGLALCEAMMLGMPVVAFATTEVATVIENGRSGFIATSLERLLPRMRELIADRELARAVGEQARCAALERFNISRFVDDWNRVLQQIAG